MGIRRRVRLARLPPEPRSQPSLSAGYDADVRRFVSRLLRATRIVVRDGRIPRPLRWGGAFAVLPIPGPLDELMLLIVGGVLWLFYRDQLREAWRTAS
jgi:hypothetical protein